MVFRVSGEILEFNAAAEAMFGRRREEVIGLNVADIIMPETLRNAHDRSLVHYVERQTYGEIAERIEMPAMRADGTRFRVEVSLVPIDESRQLLSAAIGTSPIVSSSKNSSGSRRSCSDRTAAGGRRRP